jgi:hypothetical protein
MNGQIQLSEAQVKTLARLSRTQVGSPGVLLTDQGRGDVYVSFGTTAYTITSKGEAIEEEFGL